MATAKLIETHRIGAEIYHGDICRAKTLELLKQHSLPRGLLQVDEIEEFGFNRNSGFFWLKTKKKKEHKFKSIGQTVVYNVEITAFAEKGRLSKLTGVKGKELFVPVTIGDIVVGVPSADMIKIISPIGLGRSHPISAFELEEGEEETSTT